MPTNHVSQCHISAFLEHLQGWWLDHHPGQPVPLHHHFFENKFFLMFNLKIHSFSTGKLFLRCCLGFRWMQNGWQNTRLKEMDFCWSVPREWHNFLAIWSWSCLFFVWLSSSTDTCRKIWELNFSIGGSVAFISYPCFLLALALWSLPLLEHEFWPSREPWELC